MGADAKAAEENLAAQAAKMQLAGGNPLRASVPEGYQGIDLQGWAAAGQAAQAAAQAADVFPVKAYTKPDEAIVVKFVNEKGEEGKTAVAELGVAAAKLDSLFTPAPAADIAAADGAPAFKIYSATGETFAWAVVFLFATVSLTLIYRTLLKIERRSLP